MACGDYLRINLPLYIRCYYREKNIKEEQVYYEYY
jgi:hypothetical protein